MRRGCIILNQSGRLPTEYGPLKMPGAQILPNEYERQRRFCIFFTHKGSAIQIPVPKGRTVTDKFYKNVVLGKLKNYYESRRPKTGLKYVRLLHDNAPAHMARIVADFLESEKFPVILHPPYSPDLAPNDYFLFPKLKYHLSGRRCNSRNAPGSAVYQCLMGVPIEEYEKYFQKWIDRLKWCVLAGGEYFEGRSKSTSAI